MIIKMRGVDWTCSDGRGRSGERSRVFSVIGLRGRGGDGRNVEDTNETGEV